MKYEYLDEYSYLFPIADLYNIDLTKANESVRNWGIGSPEPSIELDTAFIIHRYLCQLPHNNRDMIKEIDDQLFDWGYDDESITKILYKIKAIFYSMPYFDLLYRKHNGVMYKANEKLTRVFPFINESESVWLLGLWASRFDFKGEIS